MNPVFGPFLGSGVKNTKKKVAPNIYLHFCFFCPKIQKSLFGTKKTISQSNEILEIGSKFEKCHINHNLE